MDRILVGVDGSPGSSSALAWAFDTARASDATLELVLAWEVRAPYMAPHAPHPAAEADAEKLAEDALAALIADVDFDGSLEARTEEGPAATVLVNAGRSADLLVVGAHGAGGVMPGIGSTAARCAVRSVVPTTVVPAEGVAVPDGPVVVGVDGSIAAAGALRFALEITEPGVEVVAVNAWAVPGVTGPALAVLDPELFENAAESGLDTTLAALDPDDRARVTPRVVHGDPRAALRDQGGQARLLVIGTRGHSTILHRLLGSSVNYLLHHHPTPVLVVPAAERQGED